MHIDLDEGDSQPYERIGTSPRSGVSRGGLTGEAPTSGTARGVAEANAAHNSTIQSKGKRIVTTVEKGIEIVEA